MTTLDRFCPICQEKMPCTDTTQALSDGNWGTYVIVRAGDVVADEWTNLGIVLFDKEGIYKDSLVDTCERAVRRGDIPKAGEWDDHLHSFVQSLDSKERVIQLVESIIHAKSAIQVTAPRGTLLTHSTLTYLYNIYVLRTTAFPLEFI